MAKSNKVRNITLGIILGVVILSIIGTVVYQNRQTIFGIVSYYEVGDFIQFDAVADSAVITPCYASATVRSYEDGTYDLKQSSILLERFAYGGNVHTFSFTAKTEGGHGLLVEYSCQSKSDLKNFVVYEKPPQMAFSCADSDSGAKETVKGTASGTYTTGSGFKKTDSCVSDTVVKEYLCKPSSVDSIDIKCAFGYACKDGACTKTNAGGSSDGAEGSVDESTLHQCLYKDGYYPAGSSVTMENGVYVCVDTDTNAFWSAKGNAGTGSSGDLIDDSGKLITDDSGTCTDGDMRNQRCEADDVKYEECQDGVWTNVVQVCLSDLLTCDKESIQCVKKEDKASCEDYEIRNENGDCVYNWNAFWEKYWVSVAIGAVLIIILISILIATMRKRK